MTKGRRGRLEWALRAWRHRVLHWLEMEPCALNDNGDVYCVTCGEVVIPMTDEFRACLRFAADWEVRAAGVETRKERK